MSSPTSEITTFQLQTRLLRAGAGAGKTTTLIRLFEETAYGFKSKQGHFPKIVLTTFTRKATQELRERLLSEALSKQQLDLFKYINQKSRVHISTIHGVLSLFLMQYGKELGLSPEFQLMEAAEVHFREKRVLKKLLIEDAEALELAEEYDIENLLQMLNEYYENHFYFSDLKPFDLIEMYQLRQKVFLDIVQKSESFYKRISSYDLSESWFQFLQNFSNLRDLPSDLDALQAVFDNLGRKPPFSSKKPPFDQELHEAFDAFIKETKTVLHQEAWQETFIGRHQKMAESFEKLAQRFCQKNLQERIESSALAMADIEGLSLKLIREIPWVARKFSEQWDYWMIDEYQDTSPLQVELLKHLIGDSAHFVVGDPQQSIYLFRGARSEVFNEKLQQIADKGGLVETALTNYRSQEPLLEFINSYFSQYEVFAPMQAARSENPDQVCCDVVILRKDSLGEVQGALKIIQEKLQSGALPQEICVLARTNGILIEMAQQASTLGIPVQVHSAGGFSKRREVLDFLAFLKFLVNPHDSLNLMTLLRSPWFHIGDQDLLHLLDGKGRSESLWDFMRSRAFSEHQVIILQLKDYKKRAEDFGLSETLRQWMVGRGVIDVSYFVDSTGRREANLWKILMDLQSAESTPGFNALQFIENIQSRSRGEDEGDATPIIEPHRVHLMTIHASKGLQFKHVILVGMSAEPRKFHGDWWMLDESSGKWTLSLRSLDQKRIISGPGYQIVKSHQWKESEESYRLLYVALTRARDSLSLLWTEGPRKNSWAASFPFSQEEGLHQHPQFSFRVRRELPPPIAENILSAEAHEYRDLFAPGEPPVRSEEKRSLEGVEKLDLPEDIKTLFRSLHI